MDFSQAGELLKLQQQAMAIKKELENTLIESEVSGLVITFNGEMKAVKVEFETKELIPGLSDSAVKSLEEAILASINKGVTKSQQLAAEKMQGVMSGMGFDLPKGGLPPLA